jgi:hypothetical protein
MPWQELTLRTIVACLVLTASFFIYTQVLLQIGQRFNGSGRLLLGTLAYLLFALLLGASLIFLALAAEEPIQRQAAPYILAVLAGWVLALAPGLLYLRSRMHLLRRYGLFLSRSRS